MRNWDVFTTKDGDPRWINRMVFLSGAYLLSGVLIVVGIGGIFISTSHSEKAKESPPPLVLISNEPWMDTVRLPLSDKFLVAVGPNRVYVAIVPTECVGTNNIIINTDACFEKAIVVRNYQ